VASPHASLVVADLADGAARIAFPGLSDREANQRAAELSGALSAAREPGFEDAVVGARTLLVLFDPARVSAKSLLEGLEQTRADTRAAGRLLRIPVEYGGPHAAALEALAGEVGLPSDEVARRHAAGEYEVAFMGFAPGFAYMTGLDPALGAARLSTPVARMPAGTVAIAGPYTGIYPGGTPGGWRAVGIARVRVFDPNLASPALFSPGDRVRFEPSSSREPPPEPPRAVPPGVPVFRVAAPGAFACVTGPPRAGVSGWGVPAGGPMDPLAAGLANRAAGNAPTAALLECNLTPPRLELLRPARVAWWGEGVARCGSEQLSPGQAKDAAAGEEILLPGDGSVRAYVAVAGGLDASLVAERLERGDLVHEARAGAQETSPALDLDPRFPAPGALPAAGAIAVRVVAGVAPDIFGPEVWRAFLAAEWQVSARNDRRGLRLEGPAIALDARPEVPPEGAPLGAIQVPPDGMPIVFGPDRPVTGGYARIATVVSADFRLLAQARPGRTRVRFVAVSLAEAVAARHRSA
jgi:KipI family sensor histidine kinase inhibitor